MPQTSKIFILLGALLIIAGLVYWLFGDKLGWIGRLPGDIRVENENFKFYFPITTMILASLLLSGLLWMIKRFF